MPRILRFINRFCMEGPIFNAAYLGRHLEDFETIVVGGSPLAHESHSGSVFENLGVKTYEIPEMGRTISPWRDAQTFRKVKKLILKFEPDIIHSHCFGYDGIAARFAATQDKKAILVHTFHGHIFSHQNLKTQSLKLIERNLSKKWDAIVAISSSQKDELVNAYKICSDKKTHLVPLGIDLSRFDNDKQLHRNSFRKKYDINEDEILIGIVARLAPVKNHHLFIDAISIIHQRNKKVRAIVVGDGELKDELLYYAQHKNMLTDNNSSPIIFTSWIDKVEEVLPALDIYALTSHSEGTPVSIIEAQASGLPVVATNVGGVKDCMRHNITGMLVAPSNINALYNALQQLVVSIELRTSMGRNGAEFVKSNFSYSRLTNDMNQLYNSLLQQRTKKRF